jgi:antitoxin component of RelBE/YafQ-DinJ toxin-antitoxin module
MSRKTLFERMAEAQRLPTDLSTDAGLEGMREKIIQTLESIEGYRGLEHERQADAILVILEVRTALGTVKKKG